MRDSPWQFVGWTGIPQEPYRHWAAYPEMKGEINLIWDQIDLILRDDGFDLNPERVIVNAFNHGDSSWLHRDCDVETAWTVILYLNDFWNINWGGETILVEDDEILKSFSPTPGKLIVFKSNLLHGARPVSREAPYPRIGLTFQCNDSHLQRLPEIEFSSVSAAKL